MALDGELQESEISEEDLHMKALAVLTLLLCCRSPLNAVCG